MIETIEHWESKGFRIAITPTKDNVGWYWVSGVYIGNEQRANWLKKHFSSYKEAFDAIIDYCNNYKIKKSCK